MVKVVKAFKPYLVGFDVIAYVPNAIVKDIFRQTKTIGWRCRWIDQVQEFNIIIQITKLVRGHGLVKLMATSNLEATQVNQVDGEQSQVSIKRCP